MGRISRFTVEQVHGAVAGLLKEGGDISIQGISVRAGVSVGSLYHRFGSRDALLAETWLDAVETFQAEFLRALARSGLEAALETPRFCRRDPARAQVLIAPLWAGPGVARLPGDLTRRTRRANKHLAAAIRAFGEGVGADPTLCRLAIVEMPLTVVRLYLPRRSVAEASEMFVERTYRGLMQGPQ